MTTPKSFHVLRLLAILGMVALPAPAVAGEDAPEPFAAPAQRSSPDFLFCAPRASVCVRGSWTILRARSDWYDSVTRQLTVDRHDFRSGGITGDVGIALAPRLDALVAIDYASRTTPSEYRFLVDNNRQPINQTTMIRHTGVTAGVRFALTERGRAVSALAWIPRRWTPYVGGGGGVLYYELRQWGDFVDIQDSSVFFDVFESKGWAPTAHVNGGADMHLAGHVWLTFDARYQWARPELDTRTWKGFEPLDLAGLRFSTGLNVLF
jgi:hypothetical protein